MEARHVKPGEPQYDYTYFKKEILKLTGIRLHDYKEKQMKRRINTLIARKGLSGYAEYIRLLKDDPHELAFFLDYITINVTEFFRTADHWEQFEQTVLPELLSRKREELRIWSTACSTGEEPYSLVMSLSRFLPFSRIRVLATDIDQKVLAQAEKGVFSAKSLENVPEEFKRKYFRPGSGGWQIAEEIKTCVEFRRLDLLQDEYPEELDLIVCRNVLIYFTEAAKNMIYQKFHDSLAEGGYLFTGNTEQIIYYKNFGYEKQKNFLYKK